MTSFLKYLAESETKEFSVQIIAGPGTMVEDAETYTEALQIMDKHKTEKFGILQKDRSYKDTPVDRISIWPRYGNLSRAYEANNIDDDDRFPEDPIKTWSK